MIMDDQVLNNLPAFRAQQGLSQQELADAIGVSRKTISTIETRRFTPSVVIALKLANYFNVPVEEIFVLEPSS
jgi:putative transcriptional regulator